MIVPTLFAIFLIGILVFAVWFERRREGVKGNKIKFGKTMKIQNSPVSKYHHVAILLANAHTCMYGCQQTKYFNISAPTVEEYFAQNI